MKKQKNSVSLSFFILFSVIILLIIGAAKLFYVALAPTVSGIDLKQFAKNRNTKERKLYASRGTIYDVAGETLAMSVNSYNLIAYLSPTRTKDKNNPQHVVDKEYTAKMLSPILGIEESEIISYLSKNKYQVEFGAKGRKLTEITKKKIDDLELPGIDFTIGTQRYYKMGSFASYIVGYAKSNENGDIIGELGVESYYDDILSGKDGYITYEADAYGYQLPDKPSYTVPAQSGEDIYLTIDSNIQMKAENAISNLDKEYDFDWAIVGVLDAKTGAVLASATSPTFNPNNLNTLTSYVNPLVSYAYEPGSTMKTFSWASAIEEGFYEGSKTYLSGNIEVADALISDFNKVGWGYIPYDTGFAYSSNVAATNLALKMGAKKLAKYYDTYGFGKKTGIELSGEIKGKIDLNNKVTLATASFGQGIMVTPIQMLQAYTAIANDGIMLKPYIVDKRINQDGKVTYQGGKTEIGRVMKDTTAIKMRELMHKVNYEGLATYWRPNTVKMVIKTGTAQIASNKGGYQSGKYDHIYSVAGIFPEEEPKYIIYVAVQKIIGPQKAVANMTTALVDDIASYAEITENETEEYKNNIVEVKNYISKRVDEALPLIEGKHTPIILGNGTYVIDQYPTLHSKVIKNEKIFLLTNYTELKMPDITGWSASDVKTLCSMLNIGYSQTGYGYVKAQSIPPDTVINEGISLQVELG